MPAPLTRARIRRATTGDAAAIARVEVDSWQAAYLGLVPAAVLNSLSVATHTVGWHRVLSSGTCWVWLLVADGAVVGFTSAGATRDLDDDPRRVGEVYTLYLLASAWGRGLGAALLETAQTELARRRFSRATLWVLEGNTRARRFYELSGFIADGARRPVRVGSVALPEVRYRRHL